MSEMNNVQGIVTVNPITNEAVKTPVQSAPAEKKRVSIQDVADKLGMKYNYVQSVMCHLNSKNCRVDKVKAQLILETAREMGYKRNAAPIMKTRVCETCGQTYIPTGRRQRFCIPCGEAHRAELYKKEHPVPRVAKERFWFNGNFHTHAEEIQRMKQLRAEGYSNVEIAAKIGRHPSTVTNNIGKQTADMTLMNVQQGAKNRAARNSQRRVYVATHTVNVFNQLVTDMEQVDKQLVTLHMTQTRIRKQLEDMKPAVKTAALISKVKPVEYTPVDLTNMESATPVQQ